jgi:hypothetical protein
MSTKSRSRARLCVELLESRQLLDASPWAAFFGPQGELAVVSSPHSASADSWSASASSIRLLPEAGPSDLSSAGLKTNAGSSWERGQEMAIRSTSSESFWAFRPDSDSIVVTTFSAWGSNAWGGQGGRSFGWSFAEVGFEWSGNVTYLTESFNLPAADGAFYGESVTSEPTQVFVPTLIIVNSAPPSSSVPAARVNLGNQPSQVAVPSLKLTVENDATEAIAPSVSVAFQSSTPVASLARSLVASTKPSSSVVSPVDPTLGESAHATPVSAGAVSTAAERIAFVGSLPIAVERRLADSSAALPLAAAVGNPDGSGALAGSESTPGSSRPTGPGASRPERPGDEDSSAFEESTPELATAPLPLPQGAGLLDGELPLGLAALERAVRSLTGSEATGRSETPLLLRWVVAGSWMLGAVLAYALARRQSAPQEIALGDKYIPGQAVGVEEDLT